MKPSWAPPPQEACMAAVIGAGSWGTTFANHLVGRGVSTVLMTRRPEQMESLRKHRRNPDYMNMLELPVALRYDTYPSADLSAFHLVVLAVPSRWYRQILGGLAPRLPSAAGVLSLTKGIDPET